MGLRGVQSDMACLDSLGQRNLQEAECNSSNSEESCNCSVSAFVCMLLRFMTFRYSFKEADEALTFQPASTDSSEFWPLSLNGRLLRLARLFSKLLHPASHRWVITPFAQRHLKIEMTSMRCHG